MKILHVLDHSLPLHSGYVFRTLGILRAQRDRGWETAHLTSPKQAEYSPDMPADELRAEIDGWTFHRTPQPTGPCANLPGMNEILQMRATTRRLDAVVQQERPDILHAHSPVLNGIPALRVGRKYGLPVVYEVRAFWEDAAVDLGRTSEGSLRYRATRAMETYALKRADAVTTICEGLRRDIAARGIAPTKITPIPNAVDIENFTFEAPVDEALRAELGLADSFVLGFAGSFYSYEGLDLLLRALPAISAFEPRVKVLLVGGGPVEDRLRGIVEELDLGNRVVFTGRVPHAEVDRYYGLIDILVYPRISIRLTELVTPLKPLEAMAQGKICAASNVGGHRELIKDGETGYLFAADDADALAQTIKQALAARDDWPAIRRAGRDFVVQQRNWKASVANYAPVYEALIAGR